MDYKDMVAQIIECVGGADNIESATHCITRLRFELKDESKANDEAVQKVDKVLGLMKAGGQYQVIVGNIVKDVFAEVEHQLADAKRLAGAEEIRGKLDAVKAKNKENIVNKFSIVLQKIMFPLLPTMAAVGILKGLVYLVEIAGLVQAGDGTVTIMTGIADAFFFYMPIIVGFSASKAFGGTPYVGVAIGATLLLPALTTAFTEGDAVMLFGLPVTAVTYNNQIFPTMIAAGLGAMLEKFLNKYIPSFIDFISVLITLAIMVPLTLLAVGPVMSWVASFLADGMLWIFNLNSYIAGALFGAFWQVLVMLGMHYAFIPVLNDIAIRLGANTFNPVLGAGVWALAGAALGFALKSRRKDDKAKGFSCMTSALFGITEPTIFGIALAYRTPFICAMIGGGIAGPIYTLFPVLQYSPATVGGILTFPQHMNPNGDPTSLIGYFVCFAIAFGVSAILTFITTKTDE